MIGQSNLPSALFKKRQTQHQARSRPITPRGRVEGVIWRFGQFFFLKTRPLRVLS
ncbi:hypothetical protein HanIR_Chr12g0595261 [Helianthus annuus]|nr:hypothetical protein HanIR_Chr12g0595261 [Helianthus annuus]